MKPKFKVGDRVYYNDEDKRCIFTVVEATYSLSTDIWKYELQPDNFTTDNEYYIKDLDSTRNRKGLEELHETT